MKKLLTVLAITAGFSAATAQEHKQEKITGNGKLATRNVSVTSFDELKASGVFELKLTQGASETVKLEGDENLLEYISVKNEGSKLVIDMEKLNKKNVSFNSKNKLKVHVTFKNLNSMNLSMVGDVNADQQLTFKDLVIKNSGVGNVKLTMVANKLSLTNSGVGNVTLTGKADDAVIKNSGVGSLAAGSFAVQTMNLHNTGVGSAEINAEKGVKVHATGMGSVKNKGAAPMPKKNRSTMVI